MNRYLTGCVLPGGVMLVAAALVGLLLFGLPQPASSPPPPVIVQVEVLTATLADVLVQIFASGTVRPSRQVSIVPEVSGRVVWHKPGLRTGSALATDEVFARIDRTAYEAQVAADRQRLLQAELELELERGRGAVSEREFAILRPDGDAIKRELGAPRAPASARPGDGTGRAGRSGAL